MHVPAARTDGNPASCRANAIESKYGSSKRSDQTSRWLYIPTATPFATKWTSWYPRPDFLIPIFEEAKRVRGAGAARKWLNQPCIHLGNRIPIAMCAQDQSAQDLRDYMSRYAKEFRI